MRTRNANNGNISSIINLVDSPENGFDLPLETRISDLVSTVEANADDDGFMLPHMLPHNRADVALRLYAVFVSWMKKNDVEYDIFASSHFIHSSYEYDKHNWLMERISS